MCFIISTVAMIGFETENITVQESSGEVTFRVLKSGLTAVQLSVCFTTEDLEAIGKMAIVMYSKLAVAYLRCSSSRLYCYNNTNQI